MDVYGSTNGAFSIPLTQEQISDLVGSSRPSVNQVLRRLADQGVIGLGRGKLVVLQPEALQAKATMEPAQ